MNTAATNANIITIVIPTNTFGEEVIIKENNRVIAINMNEKRISFMVVPLGLVVIWDT